MPKYLLRIGRRLQKKALFSTSHQQGQHAKAPLLSCARKTRTPLFTSPYKRAQLQTGESILVLFIIMFMGAIALIFVGKMGLKKYQITLEEYEDLDSIETAQLVTSLYEVRCTKQGFEKNCIDIHKALAFSNMTKINDSAHQHYYALLKNAKVEVKEIYPGNTSVTLFEHNASTRQSGELIRIPVSLYNSSADTHSFASLEITRFHKLR